MPSVFPTLDEIIAAYFRFHLEVGWVAENPQIKQYGANSKMIFDNVYINDLNWYFSDCWSSFGDYSCGTARIEVQNCPVLLMQYGGPYSEEAIPCVKAALRDAYENGRWYGGRGRHGFTTVEDKSGLIVYYNEFKTLLCTRGMTDTYQIQGNERVECTNPPKLLGFHAYQILAVAHTEQ